jgi:hypothetical protein
MRGSALLIVAVLALAGACSPQKPNAPPSAPTAPAPAPAGPQSPAPVAAPIAAETPPPAAGPAPTKAEAVRFSPVDYAAHERRVTALVDNAESRDTSGETQYLADQGRAERRRCATRACIERSYAAEEARLRKWEGSGDIK